MDILGILHDQHGFFTRADAREAGYDDKAIAAARRSGLWTRFRHGSYALTDVWESLDDVARHRVRCRAVMRSLGEKVVLSHVSASVAHGLDVWGLPLDRVHVTRLDGGAGRVEGDVVHHEGLCTEDDIVDVDGLRVTKPARAAIEAVAHAGGEVALAHLDNLLHKGKCDVQHLRRQFEAMSHWPFTRHLHIPVRLADARSASIGETRGRWFCWAHRLPLPDLQREVHGPGGELLGTCDWWWPEHGLLGEFDGRIKYGRLLLPGQEPGDVVFAEKQREDLIREATGCRMIRIVWSDYDRQRVLAARFHRALGLAGSSHA